MSTDSKKQSKDIEKTDRGRSNNDNAAEEVAVAAEADATAEAPVDDNDLVIREGFPALRNPSFIITDGKSSTNNSTSKKKKWLIDGEEPIPRQSFWSGDNVVEIHPDYLQLIRDDCETVFTARDKEEGEAYSTGQTFFLPANMKPRCALEALVQKIFQKHLEHVDKRMYSLEKSGAEWWTLVLDDDDDDDNRNEIDKNGNDDDEEEEEDEVGLHFDADYELEDQAPDLLLHPRLATVTYISNFGAPTLILDQKSPPMNDTKKTTLEKGISKAWLSHPKLGRHTVFDGRLLHGAPALFFPSHKRLLQKQDSKGDDVINPPPAKRQKVSEKRITLLVNIWLNHWAMGAALLDDDVCTKLTTPWKDPNSKSNLKKGDDDDLDTEIQPFLWNNIDWTKPLTSIEKVSLKASNVDPAGEEEIALCNHNVTVKYGPTMEECHKASFKGSIVELELSEGAISLHVGEVLPEESEGEEEAKN